MKQKEVNIIIKVTTNAISFSRTLKMLCVKEYIRMRYILIYIQQQQQSPEKTYHHA